MWNKGKRIEYLELEIKSLHEQQNRTVELIEKLREALDLYWVPSTPGHYKKVVKP